MEKVFVPVSEKYTLTISEASAYFNIGVKTLRRLIQFHPGQFTLYCGNKQLIIRHKFEEFLDETSTI